jgi:hypothetical protein
MRRSASQADVKDPERRPVVPEANIRDIIEKKARAGDGTFAIAYALLDLSDSQEATAKALQRLGNGSASTDFGAIEALGMQIEKAAQMLGEQLESAASRIGVALEDRA